MKTGWQKRSFEDCIEKVTYTEKIQRKDFLPDGTYPIISQEEDFINGYWDNQADLFKVAEPIVLFGDHTKVLKYVDFDFVLGADGVKILKPRNFLIPKFFYYQLQETNLESLGYARHYRLLKELEIVYPPRLEQRRIVGLLDEAFAGIATAKANADKNLLNARALFESHLQSIFTQRGKDWVQKPFEDCIEDVKYTTKIQRKDFLGQGEFPIISQEADFINGYWNNASDIFKTTGPVVIFGDHTKILKYVDFDFVLGADGVKILPPKPFLNPKFFFYSLRSTPLKSLGYSRHYRLLKELQINYPGALAHLIRNPNGVVPASNFIGYRLSRISGRRPGVATIRKFRTVQKLFTLLRPGRAHSGVHPRIAPRYRRLPSLLYRRFPCLRAVAIPATHELSSLCRFGNRRYSRFGNRRYGGSARMGPRADPVEISFSHGGRGWVCWQRFNRRN